MGHGAWGRGVWGMGYGAWGMGLSAWGMGRETQTSKAQTPNPRPQAPCPRCHSSPPSLDYRVRLGRSGSRNSPVARTRVMSRSAGAIGVSANLDRSSRGESVSVSDGSRGPVSGRSRTHPGRTGQRSRSTFLSATGPHCFGMRPVSASRAASRCCAFGSPNHILHNR